LVAAKCTGVDIGMPGKMRTDSPLEPFAAEQGGQIPVVALTVARAEDRQAIFGRLSAHRPASVHPAELAAVVANLAGRTGNA